MIQNAQIVSRDLYDIAFARRRDSDALETALSTLKERHLQDIDGELRLLRPGWIEQHRQSLIGPTSAYNALNAVAIAREVIQDHLDSRTRPPDRGFTWDR